MRAYLESAECARTRQTVPTFRPDGIDPESQVYVVFKLASPGDAPRKPVAVVQLDCSGDEEDALPVAIQLEHGKEVQYPKEPDWVEDLIDWDLYEVEYAEGVSTAEVLIEYDEDRLADEDAYWESIAAEERSFDYDRNYH